MSDDDTDPEVVTRWGTIRELSGDTKGEAWEGAWRHLLDRYRPVLVSYARALLFRMGGRAMAENDGEEVVDDFLAACVEKDWLARADPELGRFRTFIRVLLARYTRDWVQKRHAKRRRPASGAPRSLDPIAEVVGDESVRSSGQVMDGEWALAMARAAIARVRTRSERNAKVLEELLEHGEIDRDRLAEELGKEPRQVALVVHQARRMMAEELWAELKQTVSDVTHLEQERAVLRPFLEGYLDQESAHSFFGLSIDELARGLPPLDEP